MGFSAALAFNPEASVPENKTNMTHAIDYVASGMVTHAVRNTTMNGFKLKEGDIIVAQDTNNQMMGQIREAAGLIVESDSDNSHAAISGLSLDIPVLLGAKNALAVLKSSAFVELDCENGIVSAN